MSERSMATCKKCREFLHDSLPNIIDPEIEQLQAYRAEELYKILPELADCLLRIFHKIPHRQFCDSYCQGRMYARRDPNKKQDEYYKHLATYYNLISSIRSLKDDINYVQGLLLDAGVVIPKKFGCYDEMPERYLGHVIPKLYLHLQDIHDDHLHPEKFRDSMKEHTVILVELPDDE